MSKPLPGETPQPLTPDQRAALPSSISEDGAGPLPPWVSAIRCFPPSLADARPSHVGSMRLGHGAPAAGESQAPAPDPEQTGPYVAGGSKTSELLTAASSSEFGSDSH